MFHCMKIDDRLRSINSILAQHIEIKYILNNDIPYYHALNFNKLKSLHYHRNVFHYLKRYDFALVIML